MRVLVTWGSKLGGAEGIAELVVETLREAGHEVVARDVRDAPAPAGFDAAIIGGTVYENRWMGAVRHYVERHARELRRMPTWLFSSGMLDAANPRDVTALAVEIGAIGDVMFGGRHEAERIRAWAAHIAMELPTATPLGLAYQSMAMAGWTSAPLLPQLRGVPTLILMGQNDGVVPACHGQTIAELIDGAVLEVVPGSHLFPFTHAAAISARISSFLDQPARAQAAA